MQIGKSKIGRFLFFIGVILLVVFFAMDQAKSPAYGYFCIGVIAVILGGTLMMRGFKAPDESARFRTLRQVARTTKGEKS